jgi:hypothetical protein
VSECGIHTYLYDGCGSDDDEYDDGDGDDVKLIKRDAGDGDDVNNHIVR